MSTAVNPFPKQISNSSKTNLSTEAKFILKYVSGDCLESTLSKGFTWSPEPIPASELTDDVDPEFQTAEKSSQFRKDMTTHLRSVEVLKSYQDLNMRTREKLYKVDLPGQTYPSYLVRSVFGFEIIRPTGSQTDGSSPDWQFLLVPKGYQDELPLHEPWLYCSVAKGQTTDGKPTTTTFESKRAVYLDNKGDSQTKEYSCRIDGSSADDSCTCELEKIQLYHGLTTEGKGVLAFGRRDPETGEEILTVGTHV